MKKFVITILSFFIVPLLLLFALYLWTDPFTSLHEFDVNNVDGTNREYQTVELFRRNHPAYKYNSFVFGSSQACGLNLYTWKTYLPENASPFLFQAWSESITGVKQKVEWLDKNNVRIEHALIMIDIPGFFSKEQISNGALSMKHYLLSDEPEWLYHAKEYYNFIQKPSSWISFTKRKVNGSKQPLGCDSITNDWIASNKDNYLDIPKQDSLSSCTEQTRRNFFLKTQNVSEKDVIMAEQVITDDMVQILKDIRTVFEKQHTEYYIIVTPIYRYTNPYINKADLLTLQKVFGSNRVYDFTQNEFYTSDYNNFCDPTHFGTILGYFMLKEIYGESLE